MSSKQNCGFLDNFRMNKWMEKIIIEKKKTRKRAGTIERDIKDQLMELVRVYL